jgi:hypothetical protein
MRVAIASERGGFLVKQHVVGSVRALRHEPVDRRRLDEVSTREAHDGRRPGRQEE